MKPTSRSSSALLPPSAARWILSRFFALLLLLLSSDEALGQFPCTNDSECASLVGLDSTCRQSTGMCSNPFEQGCLFESLTGWNKKRVCNLEDPPEASELGLCQEPDIDYMEIRIFSQNWESVFFESWLLQIILSELLGVPTTVETGTPDAKINLYDPSNAFQYGTAEEEQSLARANELGDCRLANRDPESYEPCAHFCPETWNAHLNQIKEFTFNGTIEQPASLGMLGFESWFIPKFTVERDPTLATYVGLQGEKNRRKLADTFLRPTTWKDYCRDVSNDTCKTPDSVAQRAPQDETEEKRMFVDGLYTGHFRKTAENNCTQFPSNCTGHIADYPCGWTSFREAQTYHLGIALAGSGGEPGSRGYSYSQLTEMWRAANATKSDLAMYWWTPESLYQTFLGSDAEFQKVLLPPPTQTCVEARLTPLDRCSSVLEDRVGDPAGACDETPRPLEKLTSSGLKRATHDPSIPDGIRNPAHHVVSAFRISHLQLGTMFDYWQTKRTPREAICTWAIENLDLLKTFVPATYPRVLGEQSKTDRKLLLASTILGGLTTLLVLLTAWKVHSRREKRAIRLAQIEFLYILLAGLLIIAVGAIVVGLEPTNGTCIVGAWLVNLGYTLELVPVIVKVAALNRLNTAAIRMRRVVVTRSSLFGAVASITVIMMFFLTLWTILDPPGREPEYTLSDSQTQDGDTIVKVSYFCNSKSSAWKISAVGWNCLLLLCATVLAFQTRKMQKDWNESHTLSIMVYSHLMFVVLRASTFALSGSVSDSMLNRLRSLIFSADTVATLIIYFAKLLVGENDREQQRKASMVLGNETPSGIGRLSGIISDPSTPLAPGSRVGSTSRLCGAPVENEVKVDGENPFQGTRESAPLAAALTADVPCPHCGKHLDPGQKDQSFLITGGGTGHMKQRRRNSAPVLAL